MASGNIIVVEPTDDYKRIHKSIIRNKNIDCLTLGIYTKIVVLGAEWQLNVKGLSKALGVSDTKIRKSIGILEREGYIKREPNRNENGKLQGWSYCVYPIPIAENERSNAGYPKLPFDETQVAAENDTPHRLPQKPTTRETDNTENGEDNNNILNKYIDLTDNKEKENNKLFSQKTKFVKPTIEEIKAYVKEKGYHIDAESFFAFYESKGWKVGKTPMASWKSACVTWERKYLEQHPNAKTKQSHHNANNDEMVINGQIYK